MPRKRKIKTEPGTSSLPIDVDDQQASPSSSSSTATQELARAKKKLKTTMSELSEIVMCPISHELMVDPVLAADGNSYERKEIEQWLENHDTSPVTNLQLETKTLFENHAVKQQIEKLVESGELDGDMCVEWLERKHKQSPEHAQELFDEGKVEEAAKLGHAKAQGLMARRCWHGSHGVTKDPVKCVEWAKKAAAQGDMVGQHYLGYAYDLGEGGLAKNWALAKEWYEKAAAQGHASSMNNLGFMYREGGHGLTQNHVTAVKWYRKGAEAGNKTAQHGLGLCYYEGEGVTKNLVQARTWLQKSADQDDEDAQCMLGKMMVMGEGGAMDVTAGRALWQRAAAANQQAQTNLDKLSTALRRGAGFGNF